MQKQKIIYTKTDEAPALATRSLLPVIKTFVREAGIEVELKDISLSGRILANFPENLKSDQKTPDALAELGKLVKKPEANIIKLPNISASIPQLKAAVAELKSKGFNIPDFPENPKTEEEEKIRGRYLKILGSAVNPVLRQGNSDRRVAAAVKQYAKDNPHSMSKWVKNSGAHVASMQDGDFFSNEKSTIIEKDTRVKVEFTSAAGKIQILKESLPLQKNEIIDSTYLSVNKLRSFYKKEINEAKQTDLLFSLHLKATMMKVSDPVLFGHAVEVFFQEVFDKHADLFSKIGVDSSSGLGDLYSRIEDLEEEKKNEIKKDLLVCLESGPNLAMVDSDKGITNLHVPSDVIIDASMPAAIRNGGKMWNKEGKLQDMKAVIPDRCYAGIYQATIDFCKEHGEFDVTKMGTVSNVGLMADKAEEYGSHDKTFIIPEDGTLRVVDNDNGGIIHEHRVEAGDIWRACQTKDKAVRDWVGLAVKRAKATGDPAVFWLDDQRAHDARLIEKVNKYLGEYDTEEIEIKILPPVDACSYTLLRVKEGKDTISVTGNVLRDYLTDLFPILELGTSAKMLSIVPLLAGGGLFETGAGGSAPKHVQQFLSEGHLRWDSLGEFLALSVSIEDLAEKTENMKAKIIAEALNAANSKILKNNKAPSRKCGEIDNRGSHFYLALYWAKALSEQNHDAELKKIFSQLYKQLSENEEKICEELLNAQGRETDIGGYYLPDEKKADAAMRPSRTFNSIIG